MLRRYRERDEVVWCQEEPQNMGAWTFIDRRSKLMGELIWRSRSTMPAATQPPPRRPAARSGHDQRAGRAGRATALTCEYRPAVSRRLPCVLAPPYDDLQGRSYSWPSQSRSRGCRRVDHRSDLSRWLKQDGDAVDADEPLFELETDKVTLEVPAAAAGVAAEIRRRGRRHGRGRRSVGTLIRRQPRAPAAEPAPHGRSRLRPPAAAPRSPQPPATRHRPTTPARPWRRPCASWSPRTSSSRPRSRRPATAAASPRATCCASRTSRRDRQPPTPARPPPAPRSPPCPPARAGPRRREERVRMTRLRQRIAERLLRPSTRPPS